MLLAAVALLLVIPLLVVAYLRMTDTTKSGTPGANIMTVFEKREGRGPVQPSPIVTAPPIAKQDSLAKPVVMDFGTEASSATSSLGFVAGSRESQMKPQPPQAQAQPEQSVDLEAVVPKAAKAQPPAKKSWAPPKLGTRQSGLKPVSWSTDKGAKGVGGSQVSPGMPGMPQGGMPPGMDPNAMMKNMMPGMDLSKMLQAAPAAGTTSPAAADTTNPAGTK